MIEHHAPIHDATLPNRDFGSARERDNSPAFGLTRLGPPATGWRRVTQFVAELSSHVLWVVLLMLCLPVLPIAYAVAVARNRTNTR
jgi:hypothetical protein